MVNIFFLGKTEKTAEKCAIMVRMTGKSGKDNVVALRGRGRPRKPPVDIDALQVPPPVKTVHKKLVGRKVYEAAICQLDYDPETGIFTWKSDQPQKAWIKGRRAGSPNNHGQICIQVNKKKVFAHRLAWFFVHRKIPQCSIDHINRDPADNRIANLRLATFSQNSANTKSSRGIFLRGVYRKKGSFYAVICKHRKRIHLGSFDTEQEAHSAYLDAAKMLHGEFACNVKIQSGGGG